MSSSSRSSSGGAAPSPNHADPEADLRASLASALTGTSSPPPQTSAQAFAAHSAEAAAEDAPMPPSPAFSDWSVSSPSPSSSGASGASGASGSTPPTSLDDDITPFPSPLLSATSLAGLSLGADGELEPEVDEARIVSDQDREAALGLKGRANKAFADKDFPSSAHLYTEAIALNPHDPTFWNNRAMAKAKMEEHGGAIADASKAILLNPEYSKAYYRRGLSYLSILRPTDAVPDFKKALAIEPGNRAVREQLNATVKLIRRIEFEKAISVGETESPSERILKLISSGSCPLDPAPQPPFKPDYVPMPLPTVPSDPNGRYAPTLEFVQGMVEAFKKGGKLPRRVIWEILLGVKAAVEREKSLVYVECKEGERVSFVGDTHGQFFDVCNLFDKMGPPSEDHIVVVNGDMVDRGSWSLETVLTFFAYKWLYPHRVFINRGNHETNDMNKIYGFEGEVKNKAGETTYSLFGDVFTMLPLATVVSASQPPASTSKPLGSSAPLLHSGLKRYFCTHGGPPVAKDGVTLADIASIARHGRQPGQEGWMMELLWTDPQEPLGRGPSKRGVGLGFGPDVTRRWCELNEITSVIRSHEVRQEGYAVEHDGLCITTFSCPNYCDTTGNKGAWIDMAPDGTLAFNQFEAVPHPDVKPMAYSSGFGFMGM